MESMIFHNNGVMGCFARLYFGRKMLIGSFTGTLRYVSLYGDKTLDRSHVEGVMSVIVKELKAYALHISSNVEDRGWRSHHALIVPARLNPLHFTNGARHLKGDGTSQIKPDSKGRQANIYGVAKLFLESFRA